MGCNYQQLIIKLENVHPNVTTTNKISTTKTVAPHNLYKFCKSSSELWSRGVLY